MTFILTSRHFKAHDTLKEFAEQESKRFKDIYDGVTRTEVILSYDKTENSIKHAEVIVYAKNHHTFTSKESSDDFKKSIEAAMDKIEIQLRKFKDKLTDHKADKSSKYYMK